ncbi:MAG: molybdopterin molybdenumtransferase MoeA, partial [Rhizobiales bacterium]|nr:molybdopterin molybdenumtransferase MoeA [Hyphomicrobiales bacterium]
RIGTMRVLGLPGNPVSTYVCALLFLVPLLRRLSGRTDIATQIVPAILGRDLAANDHRQDYMRSRFETDAAGRQVVMPIRVQDSSMMSALVASDCLLVRPPHAPPARAGEECHVIPLVL